jgi:hypothetical protein
MISSGYLVEYSNVFEDSPQDFSFYLNGIGIDRIVYLCGHFLSVDPNNSEITDYKLLLDHWFSVENHTTQSHVELKIQNLPTFLRKNPQIINQYCIYQLFEYSVQNLPQKSTLSILKSEVQVFKSILVLNEQFNNRETKIEQSLVRVDEPLKYPSLMLTKFLCYFDLVHFDLRNVGLSQFIKSYYLFSFLESYSDVTRSLLDYFLKEQKISDWKDYLRSFLKIVSGLISPDRKGYLTLNVVVDDKIKDTKLFFNNIMVDDTITFDDVDFIKLRTRPVYKLDENKFIVISPLFTSEKIYEGLFFELNKIYTIFKDEKNPLFKEDFRGFYCLRFSEEYLFYQIMEQTFPKKFKGKTGNSLREIGTQGEPDYYVHYQNKVFLFESKDVFMEKGIKQSDDFQKIEQCLREKFYSYDKSGRPVGILQLIRNIRKILTDDISYDSVSPNVKVYPILVIHHNVFNTPGLNFIVNRWFKDELMKLRQEGLNIENVHDLVIVDFNIFVVYNESFRSRTMRLEELLDDYIKITQGKEPILSNKPLEDRFYDMTSPFSMYVSNVIDKNGYGRSLGLFRELGINLVV